MFRKNNQKEVEIDIFEKENEIASGNSNLNYNGFDYDINPLYVNCSEFYIKNFGENSGNKMPI
jgi:hypothetical protein